MPKYWIVPDSNTLYPDLLLTGSVSAKLRDWSDVIDATVVIPTVVKDEMVGKYTREVMEKARSASAIRERLATFAVDLSDEWEENVAKACSTAVAAYDALLRFKIGKVGWRIASYPKVTHETLTKAATARKKPFAENGGGYRDALIWHTVLEVAAQDDKVQVLFVSNDGDFTGCEPTPPKNVAVVRGLAALYKDLIEPREKALADLRAAFKSDQAAHALVRKAIERELEKRLRGRAVDVDGDSAQVDEIEEITECDVEADSLWHENGDVIVEGTTEVEVMFRTERNWGEEVRLVVGYFETTWVGAVYDDDLGSFEIVDVSVHMPSTVHAREGYGPRRLRSHWSR